MNGKNEDIAFALLHEVITRGRNNLPYKHLLPELKAALEKAPAIHRVLSESLRGQVYEQVQKPSEALWPKNRVVDDPVDVELQSE